MVERIYQDESVRIESRWRTFAGVLHDPTGMVITIYKPDGTVYTGFPLTITDMGALGDVVKDSTGIYHLDFDTTAADPEGQWKVKWKATVETKDAIAKGTFYVDAF